MICKCQPSNKLNTDPYFSSFKDQSYKGFKDDSKPNELNFDCPCVDNLPYGPCGPLWRKVMGTSVFFWELMLNGEWAIIILDSTIIAS